MINHKLIMNNSTQQSQCSFIDNNYNILLQYCKPRTGELVYVPPKKLKQKKRWKFPNSIMAKWR